METPQSIADAAEDRAIWRYRYRVAGSPAVRLKALHCGACGAVQTVLAQTGMRMVAFSCDTCHRRTSAWCDGS
jgi:predicted  nucleic acid-binding Zn ribbon protein